MLEWVAIAAVMIAVTAQLIGRKGKVQTPSTAPGKSTQAPASSLAQENAVKLIQMETRMKSVETEWVSAHDSLKHKIAQLDGRKGGRGRKPEPDPEVPQPMTPAERLLSIRRKSAQSA